MIHVSLSLACKYLLQLKKLHLIQIVLSTIKTNRLKNDLETSFRNECRICTLILKSIFMHASSDILMNMLISVLWNFEE